MTVQCLSANKDDARRDSPILATYPAKLARCDRQSRK
jgi:hypothetical protein